MKKETNFETSPLNTQDAKAEAATTLTPDATNGDKIKEQTTALFAGGELSEEDQAAFIKEMEALFLDAKADAKKFTPKKYLR